MADARIEVTCPGCTKPFHVPPDEQGKITECPNCRGWVDVPEFGRPPTLAELDDAAARRNAMEYERQTAEAGRQLAATAQQVEQTQRILDKEDEQNARLDRLLDRLEAVIGQWEQLAARMGRVADRLGG